MALKNRYVALIALCIYLLLTSQAYAASARTAVQAAPAVPLSFECVQSVATRYDLPIGVLFAILEVESGIVGQANANNNGSWDMGPFQINSSWANKLDKAGIDPFVILQNGCANAAFAGWVLRQELNRSQDIWQAVGRYHSPTEKHQKVYVEKVIAALKKGINVRSRLIWANKSYAN